MNLKSVGICALLILVISLMYSIVGVGITLLIFAIVFLAMAILFSIRLEYYDKFLSFVNPGLYSTYSEKDSDFIRKKRIINIIGYYIISAITGFNAFMHIKLMNKIDTKPLFKFSEFLPFALVVLGGILITNYISILITKKSKTANKDLAWNTIIGILLAIILIGFVSFFILRFIL